MNASLALIRHVLMSYPASVAPRTKEKLARRAASKRARLARRVTRHG